MVLAQTLKDAVDAVFTALDDIPENITYVKVTIGSYDPEEDTQTLTTVNVAVQAIIYNGRDVDQDSVRRLTIAQGKHTDTDETRVLIPASELPAYTPKLTDHLLISGVKWEIYGMLPVPSNPCWILQVRKM